MSVLKFPGGDLDLTGLPEKSSGKTTMASPEELAVWDQHSGELESQLRASLAKVEADRAALSELETEPPPATERGDELEQDAYHEARQQFRAERTCRTWSTLSEFQKAGIALAEVERRIAIGTDRDLWLFVRATTIAGLPKLVRDMLRSTGVI